MDEKRVIEAARIIIDAESLVEITIRDLCYLRDFIKGLLDIGCINLSHQESMALLDILTVLDSIESVLVSSESRWRNNPSYWADIFKEIRRFEAQK